MQKLVKMVCIWVFLLVGCQADEGERTAVSGQDLVGAPILNQANQTIGELAQIILNTDDQSISYGVIHLVAKPVGFKGAGFDQQYIPVPWSQLDFYGKQQHLILSGTAEALLAYAPSWRDLDAVLDEGWDTAVQAHWQQINANPYESTTRR